MLSTLLGCEAMSKKKQPQKHRSEHAVHFVGASRDSGQAENHEREDFLSDLKKIVRKLPPDHPSRSGSEKR